MVTPTQQQGSEPLPQAQQQAQSSAVTQQSSSTQVSPKPAATRPVIRDWAAF